MLKLNRLWNIFFVYFQLVNSVWEALKPALKWFAGKMHELEIEFDNEVNWGLQNVIIQKWNSNGWYNRCCRLICYWIGLFRSRNIITDEFIKVRIVIQKVHSMILKMKKIKQQIIKLKMKKFSRNQ